MKWQILPSNTTSIILVGRLVGFDKIQSGDWLSPGYVFSVTQEDIDVARELLKESYPEIPVDFRRID
jgi:hypothetical protein